MHSKISKYSPKRWYLKPSSKKMWIFSAIVISIYLLPYIILFDQGSWLIWDNLDSNFVIYKVILTSKELFSHNSTIIQQPLGGLPRSALPSEFDVFTWLYVAFSPEVAYVINRVAMMLTAFFGMYLLLVNHGSDSTVDNALVICVSLFFSMLPFWPFGGLSIAGQPLVLYSILNIRSGNLKFSNWFILAFYPFYSNLVLSGVFLLALISIVLMFDIIRRRRSFLFFVSILVTSLFYVLSQYRLFIEFFKDSNFVSHRVEFRAWKETSFLDSLHDSAHLFGFGQAHAQSLQFLIVLPVSILLSAFVFLRGSKRDKVLFTAISIALVSISIVYGFKNSPPLVDLVRSFKSFVPIQLDRFYFLSPMLWMILFFICCSVAIRALPSLRVLIIPISVIQVLYSASRHELIVNRGSPSVRAFFAEKQFEKIRQEIGEPIESYRVASIGIHPSVALYNGYHTLDGYFPNYPLNYKHKFRKIIARELKKDPRLRNYFDLWGSRVYMFNHITKSDMEISKGSDISLGKIQYDWEAFYDLGGRYVFSAVELNASSNPRLSVLGKFSDYRSAWDVWAYRVKE